MPWEERIDETFERKKNKYEDLDAGRHWSCLLMFVGQSLWRALGLLGATGATKKPMTESAREAEAASQWLWLKRGQQWGC